MDVINMISKPFAQDGSVPDARVGAPGFCSQRSGW